MQRLYADAPDIMVCHVIARFIDVGQADSKYSVNPRFTAGPGRCAGPAVRYHSFDSNELGPEHL